MADETVTIPLESLRSLVEKLAVNQQTNAQLFESVVNILWQHEQAIGVDPNASGFQAIANMIQSAAMNSNALNGLNFMSSTPFEPTQPTTDQPPATPPAA